MPKRKDVVEFEIPRIPKRKRRITRTTTGKIAGFMLVFMGLGALIFAFITVKDLIGVTLTFANALASVLLVAMGMALTIIGLKVPYEEVRVGGSCLLEGAGLFLSVLTLLILFGLIGNSLGSENTCWVALLMAISVFAVKTGSSQFHELSKSARKMWGSALMAVGLSALIFLAVKIYGLVGSPPMVEHLVWMVVSISLIGYLVKVGFSPVAEPKDLVREVWEWACLVTGGVLLLPTFKIFYEVQQGQDPANLVWGGMLMGMAFALIVGGIKLKAGLRKAHLFGSVRFHRFPGATTLATAGALEFTTQVKLFGLAMFVLATGLILWLPGALGAGVSPWDWLPFAVVLGLVASVAAVDTLTLRVNAALVKALTATAAVYYIACWLDFTPVPASIAGAWDFSQYPYLQSLSFETILPVLGVLGMLGALLVAGFLNLWHHLGGGDILLLVCIGAWMPVWSVSNLPNIAFLLSVMLNSLFIGNPIVCTAMFLKRRHRHIPLLAKIVKRKTLKKMLRWGTLGAVIVAIGVWPFLGRAYEKFPDVFIQVFPPLFGFALLVTGFAVLDNLYDGVISLPWSVWYLSLLFAAPAFLPPMGWLTDAARWIGCVGLWAEGIVALQSLAVPRMYMDRKTGQVGYPFVPAMLIGLLITVLWGDVIIGTLWPALAR